MAPNSLALLLGPQAPDLLAAALAGYGGRLEALRAANVIVQPTGASVVTYAADVRRADGSRTRETLVATTGSRIPAGALVLAGEHQDEPVEVGIWRWPQDPALPALATATDPVRLAEFFRTAGLSRADTLEILVRGYRPARRAVLEVRDGQRTLFLKVVRPAAVADLRYRHTLIGRRLPVPPVLASREDGLIVLPEAPGTLLRGLIADNAALPRPHDLEQLLDALPSALIALPARPSLLELVDHAAGVLLCTAVSTPADEAQLAGVVDALRAVQPDQAEIVPAHGDFHEAQLLAHAGRVTGLLDVDTAGPGQRADEWATLLAHLLVLALDDAHRPTARCYATAVLAHAERRVCPRELRWRTAAAVLGLAIGPFRVQHSRWPDHTRDRIELAMHWMTDAG